MAIEPEFKKVLQQLPDKEKDKLILRFLRSNVKLADKLRFELLDEKSVEEKREELKDRVIKEINSATDRFYSPGYFLIALRYISGDITNHVYVTKDKFGEISLNIFMLRYALELNNDEISKASGQKAYTLSKYIVARVFKILILIQKQHEDLRMEFREDIESLGFFMGKNPHVMNMAIKNMLDVNWLLQFKIPEDIENIYKAAKENNY